MRISDWSSDVCSSDLRSHSGSSSRNSTPLCASEISPGRGSPPPPTRATALAVWCGERYGRSRQRSEEHTSELQSLMRISYAVFCLKKKKTTTCIGQQTQHIV